MTNDTNQVLPLMRFDEIVVLQYRNCTLFALRELKNSTEKKIAENQFE
jgi:hypothetical protein